MPMVYLMCSGRGRAPSFVLDLAPNVTVSELRLVCEDTMWRFHAWIFPNVECDQRVKRRMFRSGILRSRRNERGYRDFYLVQNGRILEGDGYIGYDPVYVIFRALGGKGGFGSMLRAIGAQIEKTTNREACRDLSGRRLRDINEEQRLKNWISQQPIRENEAKKKRRKKLEKLVKEPCHDFEDEAYEVERSKMIEKVAEAFEQGMTAATSSGKLSKLITIKIPNLHDDDEITEVKAAEIRKRKLDAPVYPNKKRALLWVADDISDSDEDDEDDEDEEEEEVDEETYWKMKYAAKDAINGGKYKAEATVTSSSVV